MIDGDQWREIAESLRRSKLRTAATALSVAWGIFMLVVLLGAGTGIQRGVEKNFGDDARNSIWVYGGRTSKAFEGYGPGRAIQFDMDDYARITTGIEEVEHATGRFYLSGDFVVKHGQETSSFQVRATHPGHRFIEGTKITAGRFLHERDLEERRKVAVIGPKVVSILYGRRDPIGTWIEVSGTPYRVVGTFDDDGWEGEKSIIYIPITTAQTAYGGGDRVHQIMFTVGDASTEESKQIAARTRSMLAARHHFDPDDERAMRVRNNVESSAKVRSLFSSIEWFVWIVGFGTILAGIVGVSNIMLISVRERTREIGIRKALGATPGQIVGQIVVEALVLTSVSGYLGLLAGLGVVELVRSYVPPNDVFVNPEANLSAVVGATVLLVVAGVVAGFIPARLAARINPVEALRAE